jgi:hypothetical protein
MPVESGLGEAYHAMRRDGELLRRSDADAMNHAWAFSLIGDLHLRCECSLNVHVACRFPLID